VIHDVKHLHIRVIVRGDDGTLHGATVEKLDEHDGRSAALVRFTRPTAEPHECSHAWFRTSELIPEAM